ncbi:hypothetical protein B566_EDAN016501, partial [Ephemera danica]
MARNRLTSRQACSGSSSGEQQKRSHGVWAATATVTMTQGNLSRPLGLLGCIIMIAVIAALGIGLYLGLKPRSSPDPDNPVNPLPPSSSPLGYYHDAAVTANCAPCHKVGRDVLMEGGSAVDAAVAMLFCDGVACLHSMGLGGGFFMTIYNGTSKEVVTLNARETAPAAATEGMYGGKPELSQSGAMSVAVPGELKGYWEAHKRYGKLPWRRLVEPSIKLCEEGSILSKYQANLFKKREEKITGSPTIRPTLAKTLRVIATEGGDALYTGSLAKPFVEDLKAMGGILTVEDMANYQVRFESPVTVGLMGNLTVYSMPAPSAGPLLALILNVLDGFIPNEDKPYTAHLIMEAFKWAFGQRTNLGDPHFIEEKQLLENITSKAFASAVRGQTDKSQTYSDPTHYGARTAGVENHGTAHINVLAKDGSAVSVTSTINSVLGAMIRSPTTDIIYNNEMDDFSSPNITNLYGLPPSPENFIAPGKRPLSSMCPAIVVNGQGEAQLLVGASGGTKILTATAWILMRNLWFGDNVKQAVDSPRLHHQLFPMKAQYEYGTLQEIVTGLEARGHETSRYTGGSAAAAIHKKDKIITANADYRREATIAVASHQSMGLGGGFLMTIYNRTTGEVMTVNSREKAPAAAYEDMYGGDSDLSTF